MNRMATTQRAPTRGAFLSASGRGPSAKPTSLLAFAATLAISAAAAFAGDGKDYTDQDLTQRSFAGKELEKATFDNAVLKEANFTGAHCAGASFRGADLTQAILKT